MNGPFLAPGIGAQGATAADLRTVFGTATGAVLPATSREVLGHGPSLPGLRNAAERALEACARVLAPA
jgi:orotidine-5'-phosphate decarboxylase